jgi:hypothetical protein
LSPRTGKTIQFDHRSALLWPIRVVKRQQMLTRGRPPAAVDGTFRAQAEMVIESRATTATVAEVVEAPARTFRTWVTDHAGEFRDTMKAARIQ